MANTPPPTPRAQDVRMTEDDANAVGDPVAIWEKSRYEKMEILQQWDVTEDVVFYEAPQGISYIQAGPAREVCDANGDIHYYNSKGEKVKPHQRFAKDYLHYQDYVREIEDEEKKEPQQKLLKLSEE